MFAHHRVTKCSDCRESGNSDYGGNGVIREPIRCEMCSGIGYLGVPTGPCVYEPGTEEKIIVLRARYALGIRPWNPRDVHRKPDGLHQYGDVFAEPNHHDRYTIQECHVATCDDGDWD